jgi:hypothetical protein
MLYPAARCRWPEWVHHIRQYVRIAAITLSVPGCLQRVHRIHYIVGRGQRRDPQAAVGFDRYLCIVSTLTRVLSDQFGQPGHPRHALRQPGLTASGPPRASPPFRDGFQPSHPGKQLHRLSSPRCRIWMAACGKPSAT